MKDTEKQNRKNSGNVTVNKFNKDPAVDDNTIQPTVTNGAVIKEETPGRQAKNEIKRTREIKKNASQLDCEINKNRECTHYLQRRAALPFPGASQEFYARQSIKTGKNVKRGRRNVENPVLDLRNGDCGIKRGNVGATLDENKTNIEQQIKK